MNGRMVRLKVLADRPVEFALKLRLPEWLQGPAEASVNGKPQRITAEASRFQEIRRVWRDDIVELALPKGLRVSPIPDAPGKVAFLDGPVVLAGLCEDEMTLLGDLDHLELLLAPDNEREFGAWSSNYRTRRQPRNLRFTPLHAIANEPYTGLLPGAGTMIAERETLDTL